MGEILYWVIPALATISVAFMFRYVPYFRNASLQSQTDFITLVEDYKDQASEADSRHQKAQLKVSETTRKMLELQHALEDRDRIIAVLRSEVDELKGIVDALRWRTAFLEKQYNADNKGRTESVLRVLGVFPQGFESQLDTEVERKAMYNAGIDYVALVGSDTAKVGKVEILEELSRDNYQGIEIGSHGGTDPDNYDSLWLDDGASSPGWWSRLVSAHDLIFVVIMACHGLDVADSLVNEGVPFVIAVRDTLPDTDVGPFVRMFYTNYKRTGDVETSFEKARLTLPFATYEKVRLFKKN